MAADIGNGIEITMNIASHRDEHDPSLIRLRHTLQQARATAGQLASDPLIGHEARALLSRLDAVAAEIAAMQAVRTALKKPRNDPDWIDPRQIWS